MPLSLLVTAGRHGEVTLLRPVLDVIYVPRLGPDCSRQRPSRLRDGRTCGACRCRYAKPELGKSPPALWGSRSEPAENQRIALGKIPGAH